MKALLVPDLPEWRRSRYQMLRLLKPGEVILFPRHWPIHTYHMKLICRQRIHNKLKYLAIKKQG